MAITSLSGKAIQPTQAKTAIYDGRGLSTAATTNTWYTVLNVTSVKGTFNHIAVFAENGGNFLSNRYLEIRITIDGVVSTITSTFTTSSGLPHGLRGIDHTAVQAVPANAGTIFEYNSILYFSQSLLVEVRQTQTGTPYIEAVVDYALV